jgi:acyl-CoA synthetase (AMP-forming)/AMP-acid ligase II
MSNSRCCKKGSVGSLVPNCEVRVVDPETMVDVPQKEDGGSMSGEFWVRGPNICIGYYRNDEATKNGFHVDEEGKRWFRTGDIGTVDKDGYVWIVDRMKEMIKYKGFQVIPAEMEAKLLEHPDVVDACVFGVYIAQMATEVPVGFVVLRPQAAKRSKEVAAEVKVWLEARVAGHKKLRGGLYAVEGVPKSPSGKILRRQLKAEWEHTIKQVVEGASARL